MDRTVAISSGWFLVGALLTYILLGQSSKLKVDVMPVDKENEQNVKKQYPYIVEQATESA